MVQHRAHGGAVVALLAALLGGACGQSNGEGTQATAGGGAGSGGNTSTANAGEGGAPDAGVEAGGSAGSLALGGSASTSGRPDPATASEFEACIYYYRSGCNRRFFECEGRPAVQQPCPFLDYSCPDAIFADGSPFTVADIIACGDTWAAASCDELNANIFPVCGLPAPSRQVGQPCVFSSQCASRACASAPHADFPDCGQCVSLVGLGEACDGLTRGCEDGLECTGMRCQPQPQFGLPLGAACERFGQCAPDLRCQRFAEQASATCQPMPGLNESCASDVRVCQSGTFCGADDRCQPASGIGATCGVSAGCQPQLFCDTEAESRTCVPRRAPGESCAGGGLDYEQSNCAEGSLCRCDDGECTSSTCVIRRDAGEVCGGANVVCIPGTECRDGRCVITGSQGLADGCPAD
jgi:hypothetical protein